MDCTKHRRHPRVYEKKRGEKSERILDISAGTAVGILALVLVKGMLLGYLLKRKLG